MLIDMQVAVAAGVALGSVLFIRRITELTQISLVTRKEESENPQGKGIVLYDLDGPLFFGAAHKALKTVTSVDRNVHTVVLDMRDIGLMDATVMSNLEAIAGHLARRQAALYLVHTHPRLVEKMRRYGLLDNTSPIHFTTDFDTVLMSRQTAGGPSG